EVAERDPVEPHRLVVDVEGPPTAVPRLHPSGPGEPSAHSLLAEAELAERQGDDGRVVDVGIEIVLELERPAARREPREADRPIAARIGHLPREQPAARRLQPRLLGGNTRGAAPE